jgi:formate/nitrite transporter FocA (FNT family)
MAVICTWTLQTASFLFIKANEDIAKIFMAAYGPLAFVAGMTEHCIANIGFLALPLFQQDLFILTAQKLLPEAPVLLHWGFGQYGWAHNQLYTVLGNFVGGTVFAGIAFQLVSHPERVKEIYRAKKDKMLKL